MRPILPNEAAHAIEVSSRFPVMRGAPIHIGEPEEIGINAINYPDWGDIRELRSGETRVFWACDVTSQNLLQSTRLPICITHTPGSMLMTDLHSSTFGSILA